VKWNKEKVEKLEKLREEGFTIKQIARILNTSYKSVETALDRYNILREVKKYPKGMLNRITKLIKQGYTYKEIASTIDLTVSQIKEIVKRYNLKEKAVEKIGFIDIENFSFNFKADEGIIISYCIKEMDGELIANVIKPKEIEKNIYDKRLVKDLLNDIKKFDRIIGYYAKRFDIPFIRSRALYYGLRFPPYGSHFFNDVYYLVKYKFQLHANKLRTACEFLGIPSKEHSFKPEMWLKALKGNERALKYILEHNKEDVISLEALWKKIYMYGLVGKRSI